MTITDGPQGVLARSPLCGVELPQTIKLIAGGHFQGNICFEATWYCKKSIYGDLFENSSTDEDDDTVSKLANLTSDPIGDKAIPLKSTRDYQVTAQYSETSTDSDSSIYACEETILPPNLGNEKPMELIELPCSDADSGATTPAVAALCSAQKLAGWFDKEVHNPMMKQPTTIKKKNTGTPPHITTTAKAS